MSVITYSGIGITVLVFCLSIACTCYKIFIRLRSSYPRLFNSTGGSMNQPLIPAITSSMNNPVPVIHGIIGPGYILGGNYPHQRPTDRYNPPSNPYAQPPLPPISVYHPQQQIHQQVLPEAGLRTQDTVDAVGPNTLQTQGMVPAPHQPESFLVPDELILQTDNPFDLPNDPPPEPDINNPYSVEAITNLVALHRTRQIPAIRIEVSRATIVEDLIQIYQKLDQWEAHSSVFCKFKGEEGLDAGGVMKDLYTTFWGKAKDIYFKGNIACVPQINLRTYDLSVFITLGRIFSHSTVLLRAVPIQICRTTLIAIVFGEMDMGHNTAETKDLVEDLLQFLDLDDRLLIQKAMKSFNDLDENELMKLRYIFETFDIPNTPIIAYNELYVKPRVVCQKMGQGIPQLHRNCFWGQLTLRHIDALYDVFRLTPKMVVEKLVCDRLLLIPFSSEKRAFENLKRFIRGMSEDLLLKFLQFVTGERKVPNGVIVVHFTDETGVRRTPRSHTCMNILELPKSYTNFNELKREFTNILNSDEAMRINME